jgi:peptidoglycan/LPS O-acetylase OafA/YrhL
VLGIAASAAAMAAAFHPGDPNRAYYGTEGRVQELFAGALLAVLIPRLAARPGRALRDTALRPLAAALGIAGLAGLLAAMVLMSDSTPPYYRGGALGVSLAAAALIAAVELAAGRGAGLSIPVAVGSGRISYGCTSGTGPSPWPSGAPGTG